MDFNFMEVDELKSRLLNLESRVRQSEKTITETQTQTQLIPSIRKQLEINTIDPKRVDKIEAKTKELEKTITEKTQENKQETSNTINSDSSNKRFATVEKRVEDVEKKLQNVPDNNKLSNVENKLQVQEEGINNAVKKSSQAVASAESTRSYMNNYVPLDVYNAVVSRHLVPIVNTFVRVVNSFPQTLYAGTMALTNNIAEKLQDLGDAYSGNNSKDGNNNDLVQIKQKHFDYLEKVRKSNPKKFKEYEVLASTFSQLPATSQLELIRVYFKVNVPLDEHKEP